MILCLQVGYCQGMAFVAGIILMYLPEEPAYRSALSAVHAWPAQAAQVLACATLKRMLPAAC